MRTYRYTGLAMAVLLGAGLIRATTLERMSLEQLTAVAERVVRVRCVAVESRFEDGEIWTRTHFVVHETLKGTPVEQLTVRLLGGRVGHLTSTVDGVPKFTPGEELYLFLEPSGADSFAVTSWVQGTFRIRRGAGGREFVVQDTSGVVLLDPATGRTRPGGVRDLPIEEFRDRVRAAAQAPPRGR
ncbi:MAG: hypothetical protein K6U02_04440 [Firmicutes bacterium]|nr:hypothetical protein [Bacillota bacterium]